MITYKDAGVDVERGYEAVRRMKQHVAATFDENVLGGLGSFGGFYSIENADVDKPVLVAGTARWALTAWRCASTTWSARAQNR